MIFTPADLRLLALSDAIDNTVNRGGRPRKPDSELKAKRRWRRKVGGRPRLPPHEDPKKQARRDYLRVWARKRKHT